MSFSPPAAADPHAETAAWFWLAYDSGLSLRRAKTILLALVRGHSHSLHEVLAMPASGFAPALGLSPEERQLLEHNLPSLAQTQQKLAGWRGGGLGLIRLDQPAYPSTLTAHMNENERPLFVCHRGDISLLELPTVLAVPRDEADDAAEIWATETLLELAIEGALPLLAAQPGRSAASASHILAAEAPLALVIPQGLAAYEPPAALATAIAGGRALLLSPFRPDWTPPPGQDNPMAPHADSFAQALAHALLLSAPPYPANLLPQQPCFLRPGAPKTVGCQTYYSDAESFFLALSEIPAAAAPFLAENPPDLPLPQEPPLDAESLINRLAAMGNVPEALKARLRTQTGGSTSQ